MGFAKNRMIEEQERGWSSVGDKYVCPDCFNDYALARFVKANASSTECDYCGKTSKRRPLAAPLDDVIEYMDQGICSEWDHPDDAGVAYDSREGGYQGTVLDAWDLFHDVFEDHFNNDDLLKDVTNAYISQGALFCQRDFYALPPADALRYGWQEFGRVVKHETRYVFLVEDDRRQKDRGHEEIPPSEFLFRLGDLITDCGLVRELDPGSCFFRVRVHQPDQRPATANDLGPPPTDRANYPNRMSPAGIPMFYGAMDRKTALIETYDPSKGRGALITTGAFFTARSFPIADFTRLPSIPSIFDAEKRGLRHSLIFLHRFVVDLSTPVTKDGREHIEYVPTQVITEYLRRVYSHPHLGALKGILYRSAQRRDGTCCVLFLDSEDCTNMYPGWDNATTFDSYKWWLGLNESMVVTRKPPRRL